MSKFCRNCGKPVAQDEKFCHSCGCALISAGAKTLQNTSATKFCGYCGKVVSASASFCRNCGRSLVTTSPQNQVSKQAQSVTAPQMPQAAPQVPISATTQSAQTAPQVPQAEPQTPVAGQINHPTQAITNTAITQPPQQMQKATNSLLSQPAGQLSVSNIKTLSASTSAGELYLGELTSTGLSNISETTTSVLAPFSGILHGAGSFFKGMVSIFRKPSALIGVILITILWFVLAMFRDSDTLIVKILSWITFSEGGLDRTIIGALGGILGKGTVAAALISFFNGGLKNTFKGIKTLFTGRKGEKRGIVGILIGTLAGTLLYFAFTGKNASAATAMAGISGMIISLQALGSEKGKLYDLALSLTSRKNSDGRLARPGKCDGLLTGLTIGFALGTMISFLISLVKVAESLL